MRVWGHTKRGYMTRYNLVKANGINLFTKAIYPRESILSRNYQKIVNSPFLHKTNIYLKKWNLKQLNGFWMDHERKGEIKRKCSAFIFFNGKNCRMKLHQWSLLLIAITFTVFHPLNLTCNSGSYNVHFSFISAASFPLKRGVENKKYEVHKTGTRLLFCTAIVPVAFNERVCQLFTTVTICVKRKAKKSVSSMYFRGEDL